MAQRRLFARYDTVGSIGTLLAFAASDIGNRRRGASRSDTTYDVLRTVGTAVANGCGMAAVPLPLDPGTRVYNSMQFFAWRLSDRPDVLCF